MSSKRDCQYVEGKYLELLKNINNTLLLTLLVLLKPLFLFRGCQIFRLINLFVLDVYSASQIKSLTNTFMRII